MKIFLDDLRQTPQGWVGVSDVEKLENLFTKNIDKVTHISLDNSLGLNNPQGKTFVDDFISNQWYVKNIFLHSADFLAVEYMKERLEIAKNTNIIAKDINVKIVSYPDDFS